MSNFPTLDGLNNIEADSGNLTNITCQTFIATTSAQAPTMPSGNISNNIATTAFVDDAITNAPFVTTDTTQTLTTGTKFFTNNPQSLTSSAPTLNNEYTNKKYVDDQISSGGGSFVTLATSQTIASGAIKTFTSLPVSSATPTTSNQLVPKNYVDTNFLALTGSQTVTGNKTFFPTTGTTIIRGTQADIFADTTFLTGNTTTISGVNCNITSTTNYIAGTTTNIATPTLNVQNTCGNFNVNATNTNLTGTIATATTQATADNSTKLATTAFVNNYGNANYMTIGTNQNVSGVKTYSTKQIFNAGTASSTYDNTSLTDMSLAGNSGNGILSIAGGRIVTDNFGVRIAETLNLQLNEGTFIQPIPSLSLIDEPVFTFGLNQSEGYVDIVAVPRSAQATKKINTGIFSWFAGNNQSTTFTITHSIVTTSLAGIGTMFEAEVYFYFQDNNTGIIRYITGNLATTTGFTLLPSSTYIRPTITFTLTTATLPQGAYSIYGYSRVTDAYSLNAGFLSVNFNLSSPVSGIVTTQNYNTPKDYIFTSRNVYHCFRNYVAGVYIVNNIATQQNIMTPLFYSISDFTNMMFQPTTSGAVSTPAQTGGTAAGNFTALSVNNADNYYLVYPNYSLVLYDTTGWTGAIYINFKNTTANPVMVAPTTTQRGSSCRIYFDEVELIKY